MKKGILIILAFCVSFAITAQNKDIKEETVVKKTIVKSENDQQEMVEKVVVKQEQDIEMKAEDAEKVDQSKEETPVKVTTTKTVDTESEPTVIEKETFYNNNGKAFKFSPNDMGFSISENDEDTPISVFRSQNKNLYYVQMGNSGGVGYFDDNSNFVIELFDNKQKVLNKKTFELTKEED